MKSVCILCVLFDSVFVLKVSHLVGHMPNSSGESVGLTPNVEAIVADMKYMGTGLVSDIQLNTDKWT